MCMCACVLVCAHVYEMMAEWNTSYRGDTSFVEKHTSFLDLCAAASTSYMEPKERVASIPPPVTCTSNSVIR